MCEATARLPGADWPVLRTISGFPALSAFSATRVDFSWVVTVSMGGVGCGKARFFCYRDRAGHLIRFVLARGDDGTVRSVFDACRRCYRFHKGYTIADGFLICRLCGNRYRLDEMRVGLASCQPVQIENAEHDGKVELQVAALERGHSLF